MISMSIKEYATSNKLSIYNVIKMTKSGSLQTQTQKVDGKDETFILVDETRSHEVSVAPTDKEEVGDYEKAYFKLKLKYNQLLMKYQNLQKKI